MIHNSKLTVQSNSMYIILFEGAKWSKLLREYHISHALFCKRVKSLNIVGNCQFDCLFNSYATDSTVIAMKILIK